MFRLGRNRITSHFGPSLRYDRMGKMRTNRACAIAAIADAALICCCGTFIAAMQLLSPDRSFKAMMMRYYQTVVSQQIGSTTKKLDKANVCVVAGSAAGQAMRTFSQKANSRCGSCRSARKQELAAVVEFFIKSRYCRDWNFGSCFVFELIRNEAPKVILFAVMLF